VGTRQAGHTHAPRSGAPATASTDQYPWRGWTFSPRIQRQKRGQAGSQRPAGGYFSRTDHAEIVDSGPNTAVAFSPVHPNGSLVSTER
jgi:hypothetical protein